MWGLAPTLGTHHLFTPHPERMWRKNCADNIQYTVHTALNDNRGHCIQVLCVYRRKLILLPKILKNLFYRVLHHRQYTEQ